MKNKLSIVLLVVTTLGLTSFAFGQADAQVAKIRSQVAAINKGVTKYKKTVKSVDDISLEGTEATFFSQGGVLKKTNAKVFGESYRSTVEIYYEANTPIFIYEKLEKYDHPIGSPKMPKVARIEETRIYYAGEQVVRLLLGTKERKPGSEDYESTTKEFAGIADAFFKAFKK